MKSKRNASLRDTGELAAIERLCRHLSRSRDVMTGVGDDCAVVRTKSGDEYDLLLTSDAVIENIHFKPGTPPSAVGHKAVARVLSDIAAMGGKPKWALIDLVAPPGTLMRTLDAVYSGVAATARKYGLSIVGGDMASGQALELHVFAAGSVPAGKGILRSGAWPGHAIFVTGSLGGSFTGKHLSFAPRMEEGQFLRKWATSMIDVSDGLASDLRHLTAMSGTGALIFEDMLPVSKAVHRLKGRTSALGHVLHDGEDFELLFTVPARRVSAFTKAWKKNFSLPCTMIGKMTGRRGFIECAGRNGMVRRLEKTGYQHFKQ